MLCKLFQDNVGGIITQLPCN